MEEHLLSHNARLQCSQNQLCVVRSYGVHSGVYQIPVWRALQTEHSPVHRCRSHTQVLGLHGSKVG